MTKHRTLLLAMVLAAQAARGEEAPSSAPPAVSTPEPSPESARGRQLAREYFEAGVALVRAGHYSQARAEFMKAYAAAPHFIVLYNIGLVEIQLGNFVSAAQFLRQYLAEGNGAIVAEQRDLVEREIARLDALSVASPEAAGANVLRAEGERPRDVRNVPPISQHSMAGPTGRTPSVNGRELAFGPAGEAVDVHSRLTGYLLVCGGFAAMAGAAVAHIWNHDRYLDWKRRHEELATLRQAGPLASEDEASVRARIGDTNSRLRSVRRFDPIPVVLAGLGVVAAGVGVWTLTQTTDDSHFRVASQPSGLMLETSWRW